MAIIAALVEGISMVIVFIIAVLEHKDQSIGEFFANTVVYLIVILHSVTQLVFIQLGLQRSSDNELLINQSTTDL